MEPDKVIGATTISAYIKSLDSTHMVTLGDEGFMNGGGDGSYPYTTGEGIDFAANLKITVMLPFPVHIYLEQILTHPEPRLWYLPPIPQFVGRNCRLGQRMDHQPRSRLRSCQQTLHPRGIRLPR